MEAIVDTLDFYVRLVSENLFGDDWILRGHPDASVQLLPAIDRTPFRGQLRERLEQDMFERFKREGRPALERVPENDFEWLCLARKHGLPTRLLDWSRNPLEALYFGVADASLDAARGVSCVLAYSSSSADFYQPLSPDELAAPLEIEGEPRLVDSFGASDRTLGQTATFTLHPEMVSRDRAAAWPGELHTFVILSRDRRRIRSELRLFGTHRAKLFPDLDGLAFEIREDALEGLERPTGAWPSSASSGSAGGIVH